MVSLVVEGSATHRHRAERGVVHLTLGFDGDDREQVARDAIALHNDVTGQATRHRRSNAATWWTAQSVTTGPVREWGTAQEARVVFRSRSRVDVRFQDFDALASWIGDLVDRDGVSIDGIDWSLGHERRDEVEREVRVAAVADVVARAGDYAAALGLEAPRLETLYEAGLRPGGGGGGGGMPYGVARSMMAGGGGEAYDLNPADIEVTVTVSADFSAEGPGAGSGSGAGAGAGAGSGSGSGSASGSASAAAAASESASGSGGNSASAVDAASS